MGIAMAWYNKVDMYVRPLFDLLKPIPGVAWVPLMIIMLGIGFTSKVTVIFISAIVPVLLNAYSGIKQTKDVHIWVARTFGATDWQMLTKIAIPTSLPYIMTGVRVALGSAWTTIVAAELIASTEGLGFMIQQSRGIYRPDIIIVGMMSIGIIGALLAAVLLLVEKLLVKGRAE
jgi:NitT/TauT family transport system permease protein/taurine transport system permease protein